MVWWSWRRRRYYQPLSHLQPQVTYSDRGTTPDNAVTASEQESGVVVYQEEDRDEDEEEGHGREDVTEESDETAEEDGEEDEDTMEKEDVSTLRTEEEKE